MQVQDIEFRGKDIKTGEWRIGSLYYFESPLPEGGIITDIVPFGTEGFFPQVDPETVGQYIGLKDKKDNDIFTDDIVRDKFGDIGVIIFSEDFCGYKIKYYGVGGIWRTPRKDIEVIGNIHDNPELAEKLG